MFQRGNSPPVDPWTGSRPTYATTRLGEEARVRVRFRLGRPATSLALLLTEVCWQGFGQGQGWQGIGPRQDHKLVDRSQDRRWSADVDVVRAIFEGWATGKNPS